MLLITGANGQLGQELQRLLTSAQAIFVTSKNVDITNALAVSKTKALGLITGIINCAAYTAVDNAEDDRERAFAVNVTAVRNLGLLAQDLDVPILHLSTDYVFDGLNHRPYRESDSTNPVNYYGETKLLGERALLEAAPKCAVIRTSWLYSKHGKNFVQTMLKIAQSRTELNVIFDQIGTPTYAEDLAKTLLKIIARIGSDQPQIYHYSNEGVCSWYDFAKAIFEIRMQSVSVRPILSAEYPTRAIRPFYSVLDKSLIKSTFGLTIPHWREGLVKCLA